MLKELFHPEVIVTIIVCVAIFGLSYIVFSLFSESVRTVNERFLKSDKEKKRDEVKAKQKKAS